MDCWKHCARVSELDARARGAEVTYSEWRCQISAKRIEYARVSSGRTPSCSKKIAKEESSEDGRWSIWIWLDGYTDENGKMGEMGEMGFNVPQLRMSQAPWVRRPVGTEGPRTIGDKVKVRAWPVRRSTGSEGLRSFGPSVLASKLVRL
jgi:hypothetical protein